MPARRTPKPAAVAKMAALALRLEVNILKDGRSYTTILDMTKGQGVPVDAVPAEHSGKAADAIVGALCSTPGILEQTVDQRPLTMLALAKGEPSDGCTLFMESAHASHEAIIDAATRMIAHLSNVRITHASALAKTKRNNQTRKSLN